MSSPSSSTRHGWIATYPTRLRAGVGNAADAKVKVLATTPEEGQERPMVWTTDRGPGQGRSFSTILGHYSWTFDDPLARVLILRGMAWAAGEDNVDRFAPLALEGVRLRDRSP